MGIEVLPTPSDIDGSVPPTLTGDPIVNEARKRFDACSEWEAIWRQRCIEDIRFANGDSDNGYQWPNEIRNARDTTARPCLTINLIRQHNNMISNEARKNKSTVRYVGMGNGATQQSANVFRDLHRHIEYQSQAQTAYTIAREFAVDGGIGWWRLVTEYEDWGPIDGAHRFNQELFVRPINDPLSVYMDPAIQQRNGSDAMYAFVFDDVPKDEFEEAYPDFRDVIGHQPLGLGTISGDWITKHKIRVCEYFRKVPKKHRLVSFVHMGERHTTRYDTIERLVMKASDRDRILDDPQTKIRDVTEHEVEWYLIAGEQVIDHTVWIGKYIPLIRVIGNETVIEGTLDRKGHTRWMKDAQRMFNYNASGQVEFVGAQTKTPWLVPAKAIEEFESMWNTANVNNAAVLPYNHVDPEGDPSAIIPPPQKIPPPSSAPAYQEGMETAMNQIMMVSGQFQNQLGMLGNERTGKAIQQRQAQSDTANFHFQDNYEDALIFEGMQFLDIIPKLYDTKRVKRIIADDGIEYDLEIDPTLRQGYLEQQDQDGKVIKRVLNPNIGRFDVAASVGPAYSSKREETREALTLILTQAPGLVGVIGDLLMKAMDFDSADEAALRLRRMVPPIALGTGPTQNEQMMQQQMAALQAALVKALDGKAKDQLKLAGKDELRDIEVYDAETKRMSALAKMLPTDPEGLRQLIEQLVEQSLTTSLQNVMQENKPDEEANGGQPINEAPPIPGANKAPNGEWYLTDPTRKGKYLHIAPLAQLHNPKGIIGNA